MNKKEKGERERDKERPIEWKIQGKEEERTRSEQIKEESMEHQTIALPKIKTNKTTKRKSLPPLTLFFFPFRDEWFHACNLIIVSTHFVSLSNLCTNVLVSNR